ncbi:MAG: HAD hydrolase-like protein [bacterium]|nr:HAD hydrolase-like protein [bacterium]
MTLLKKEDSRQTIDWPNIRIVLLDMDGVLTSEEAYWDAAGLTVREILESPAYLGLNPAEYTPVVDLFYKKLSRGDRTEQRKYLPNALIAACKIRGINSNWDLAYLALGLYLAPLLSPLFIYFSLIAKGAGDSDLASMRDVNRIDEGALKECLAPAWDRLIDCVRQRREYEFLRARDLHLWGDYFRRMGRIAAPYNQPERLVREAIPSNRRGLELLDALNGMTPGNENHAQRWFGRSTEFWRDARDIFQSWYLGGELYHESYGVALPFGPKPGLIHQEEPLLGRGSTHLSLQKLKNAGIEIGIATGRPRREILTPLKRWDALKYFAPDRIATHDEVEQAETELRESGMEARIGKPHPFIFLRALFPVRSNKDLVEFQSESEALNHVLIVGDAQADIWAAQAMGSPCAAVLSGVAGQTDPDGLLSSQPAAVFDTLTEIIEKIVDTKK